MLWEKKPFSYFQVHSGIPNTGQLSSQVQALRGSNLINEYLRTACYYNITINTGKWRLQMCSWKAAFSHFYILIIAYSDIAVYSEADFVGKKGCA